MSPPALSVIALFGGGIVAVVGNIILLVAAFRQHVIWGLVALFAPCGNIVYACVHWAEAKVGLLMNLIGVGFCFAGILTSPEAREQLAKAGSQFAVQFTGAHSPAPTVSLDTQILDQRQKLEALQSAFAQNGAQLTAEYQALDAQRKALKQGDTAAITKFNVAAADYQTRNQQRKQMQQDIDAGQKQLDALLDARSRAAATPKVLMYTTSHCPACKAAKQYLAQKGVPYQEIDVEQSRDGAEAFQKLGGRGVPLIMVGEKRMDGFNPQALEAVLAGA